MGAGYIQYQILPIIDRAIEDGSFFTNTVLTGAIMHARSHNSALHLMGLLSPGGVHSHMNHLFALLHLAAKHNFREPVYIHLFTDGRDSPPASALTYLHRLEEAIGKYGVGAIASVTGRFYAMDRNQNWERTEAAYTMLTGGKRPPGASSAQRAIRAAFDTGISDEMIPPMAITRGGAPLAYIHDGDAVIFFNFRPDRARQLMHAFVAPQKVGFAARPLQNLYFATLGEIDKTTSALAAWYEDKADYPLACVIADASLTQLHIAETEKYAHITYYLNVGHTVRFPGEEHVMIRSSNTRTFAHEPRMAAAAITDRLLSEISRGYFDVYFVNYANPDMLGHTGDFTAAVTACEFIDQCLERLRSAILQQSGTLIVTADHGNVEEMINLTTHEIDTEHTSNAVPFYYVRSELARTTPKSAQELRRIFSSPLGVLADVAPTVLDILRISKPATMTGVSLLDSLQ